MLIKFKNSIKDSGTLEKNMTNGLSGEVAQEVILKLMEYGV